MRTEKSVLRHVEDECEDGIMTFLLRFGFPTYYRYEIAKVGVGNYGTST
jgi:hypothetical protein